MLHNFISDCHALLPLLQRIKMTCVEYMKESDAKESVLGTQKEIQDHEKNRRWEKVKQSSSGNNKIFKNT